MTIKYFSMFSGIGGFEVGMHNSRYKNELECVGFSEVNNYAISIYSRWFPNHRNYGDATTIDTSELDDFSLLIGGFPCQSFSICGKQQGLQDTRGTLFFEIARVLKDCQPRYFLLENVKGLVSNDGGGEHLIQSLKFFPNWGMMYCGRLIIRATMEYPNIDSDCSLKDILERNVDTKYLMSKEMLQKVRKEQRK